MKYVIKDNGRFLEFTNPEEVNAFIQNYYDTTDYGVVCVEKITNNVIYLCTDVV